MNYTELFIKILPELFKLASSAPLVMTFIHDTKANLQARGEWSREADDAFTAEVEAYKPEI